MATEEVSEGILADVPGTKKRVAFFASSLDAFLQDFLAKAIENDHLGALVAAARVAQIASAICQEYEHIASCLIASNTEKKAAEQAADLVIEMVNRNGEQCGLERESAQVAAEPKGTLSN